RHLLNARGRAGQADHLDVEPIILPESEPERNGRLGSMPHRDARGRDRVGHLIARPCRARGHGPTSYHSRKQFPSNLMALTRFRSVLQFPVQFPGSAVDRQIDCEKPAFQNISRPWMKRTIMLNATPNTPRMTRMANIWATLN